MWIYMMYGYIRYDRICMTAYIQHVPTIFQHIHSGPISNCSFELQQDAIHSAVNTAVSSHRGRAMVHQVLLGSWGPYRWFWVDHGALICIDPLCRLRRKSLSLCRYCDSFYQVEAKGKWAFAPQWRLTSQIILQKYHWMTVTVSFSFVIWSTLQFCCQYPYMGIARWIHKLHQIRSRLNRMSEMENSRSDFQCFWNFGQTWNRKHVEYLVMQINVMYYLELFGYMIIISVICILWYDIHTSFIWYIIWYIQWLKHEYALGVGCFCKSRRRKSHRQEKYGPKMARWGTFFVGKCRDWMILWTEVPKKYIDLIWLDPLHLLDFNNIYMYINIFNIHTYRSLKESDGSAWVSTAVSGFVHGAAPVQRSWLSLAPRESTWPTLCLVDWRRVKTMESFFVGKVPEAQHLQLLPFEWRRLCWKGIHCIHLTSFCWLLDVRRVQWRFVWNVLQQAWYLYK